MASTHHPFLGDSFLRSVWGQEYESFKGSAAEAQLFERLSNWRDRKVLSETESEEAFIDAFFRDTWGYRSSGHGDATQGYSMRPQFAVEGAGQTGGKGKADLALAWFNREGVLETPQVLCEFKDIKSDLDAPQKRKGNTRSPVQQCKDYLWGARQGMYGNESIIPTWGIATDMNEFRLYWWDRMPAQYMRFIITPKDLFSGKTLLEDSDEMRFQRFLFFKLFHADTLLTTGGKSPLEKLLASQWVREREIEKDFYKEYRAYRDRLYKELTFWNPDFQGTRVQLVRLSQKILDRCLFVFYCEDMGQSLDFPPNLLTEVLKDFSCDPHYDPDGFELWERVKKLFRTMNEGGLFPDNHTINKFNGGLFANDPVMESLRIPNKLLCAKNQGNNEASLQGSKDTLLYLAAYYNYADRGDADKTLGLYTLGRIFEQSITELEILEAEAEGRPSVNKLGKRKTDGVYYTPENIVEKIVEETLGLRLQELRAECGWKEDKEPDKGSLNDYWQAIHDIKIVDPACGSGAFLITALHRLRNEYRMVQELRRQHNKGFKALDETKAIEDILANNIYGVDISPASVEISKLALWLHTARAKAPLSALDRHIREGNSLVDKSFYIRGDLVEYTEERKEIINAFDWWEAFPEVEKRGGFDVVIGNPPYVKFQNFTTTYPEVEDYLSNGRQGKSFYESTQTGSYDLYVPFIEKGIALLNDNGRMGFIAPSLWVQNDYGKGLRKLVHKTGALDRWADFKSHQIFDEATTYTALQFFSNSESAEVAIHSAPKGDISAIDWQKKENRLSYKRLDKEGAAWALLPQGEKALIDKINTFSFRLGDDSISEDISQGLISGAYPIYAINKLGKGRYTTQNREGVFEIEDSIMMNLSTGPDIKRYRVTDTDLHIIFPYRAHEKSADLISEKILRRDYPNAWKYLYSFREFLRTRDKGKMNHDGWYGYSRTQNLFKQNKPKIIIAGTETCVSAFADEHGLYAANDKRVYSVFPVRSGDLYFLLGVLNGTVCDYIFRRIARPKANGYFDIEKQFLAPLPIPKCDAKQTSAIAAHAKLLQKMTTRRAEVLRDIEHRLTSVRPKAKPEEWLLPDVGSLDDWLAKAPDDITSAGKNRWAKEQRQLALEASYEDIQRHMRPGVEMQASFAKGELSYSIDGKTVIDRIFVNEEEGAFIQAQWDVIAATFNITEKAKAKKLVDTLRKLVPETNQALVKQVVKLRDELQDLDAKTSKAECEINDLLFKAYDLTEEEIELVKQG